MIKKKPPKLDPKPRSQVKIGGRSGERERLQGVLDGLSKSHKDQGVKILRQAGKLKSKERQLRNGVEKQIKVEEQVYIRTKAMEATADGIFIIDAQKPDFPIIYANRSFQDMTGYTKREILDRDYFLFYGTSADPRIVNEIKQTICRGKSFHGEMLNFKKNGKKYWNSLRIAPVRDPKGVVTHYVGIQTDVTLMRDRELEIDEQREELLHVTRVGKLAEFVSSLAHEISQPLAAILLYAQAAQRMLSDREPGIHKILSYIINDDKRAVDIIHRLRALLKKSKPEMKPLDINTLINETVKLIVTDAAMREDVITVELNDDIPLVHGDRIQLQQVLLNLISNSFDALEDIRGERVISIRTSRKDADTVKVEVEDTGCGIPEHNIPKLFTHFFTSKPDGLGMGLSISRSIVEAHGGRLEGENTPEGGAIFYFTLPFGKKDVS
jgi:PAS domain S-box-containing protein